jgi:hypothetical protein
MDPLVLKVVRDDPGFGLRVGQVLVVWASAEQPIVVQEERPPNFGRVLGLLEDGVLVPIDGRTELRAQAELRAAGKGGRIEGPMLVD